MDKLNKGLESFIFYSRLHLSELTGRRAATLVELLNFMRKVSDACIYHHTHRFLQQHQFLSPEPPNDFAHWITHALGEDTLGEMLASIDIIQFCTIKDLRQAMIKVIDGYLKKYPRARKKFANPGEEFYFIKSISFFMPTPYVAADLREFAQALELVTIDSIYFHIFEARLRLEKGINDFSYWLETSVGEKKLADKISRLDPYTYTMNDLRAKILKLINQRLAKLGINHV